MSGATRFIVFLAVSFLLFDKSTGVSSASSLRSPESFAEPPGILGSPAWHSLDV